jgi:hypothetical protein
MTQITEAVIQAIHDLLDEVRAENEDAVEIIADRARSMQRRDVIWALRPRRSSGMLTGWT